MNVLCVFLKKTDGWCYLLSSFDEGSPIRACATQQAFCLSRTRARPKVNAKLHTIFFWLSAVMTEIPVRAHEGEIT